MTVIWQACAGHEWCVHIPFDGDKCLSAQVCVRVLEEGTNFFLEVEILGARERIPLGNACLEARYYVFAAKACVANLNVQPHRLQFDIVLRLCIDASIGPIHVGECVDIYKQHVSIGFLTASELETLEMAHPARHHQPTQTPVRIPAFVELTLEPSQEAQVKGMF
jgi:hypothetical protein